MSETPEKRIADAIKAAHAAGFTQGYQQGYRDGYNEHAASRAKSEQMFGTYQHGKGENP